MQNGAMKRILSLAFGFTLALACAPARAVDGAALTAGTGPDAQMISFQLIWDWDKKWLQRGIWELTGYWQLDLSSWKGDGPAPERRLHGVGITPIFRYQQQSGVGPGLFVEAGIGVYEFSGTQVHGAKRIGTAFEFGDHIGFGIRFGPQERHDLAYRLQHYSNGGISKDNSGVNFHQIRLKLGL
jgi:lipid A 3-O-deacylase